MNREKPDFHGLYSEYGDGIYRLCLRMTGSVSDAEDITQETFLAVMQGWHRFRGEATPLTWIYRIAARKARRCVRMRVFRPVLREPSVPEEDSALRIDLVRALAKLSLKKREAFVLVKVEGLTLKQASEVVGIPEGTMKFRVFDAIRDLRRAMGESYEPHGMVHGHEL